MSMKTILKETNGQKPDRVCSIDASTNSLAFAIFSGNSLEQFGKINFQGMNTYAKVKDAARKTLALFKQFEIDAIVIEHTVFINSPKTAADLALVQGGLLGAAGIAGIIVAGSVNPISWQIFIGNPKLTVAEKKELESEYPGKSKAWYQNRSRDIRKIRTIQFVNTYYDKEVSDNDVADAIGIGHWAINNWGKLTK
jgi:Holliday junction resolvasome RuvABC endonuclease subunit